MEKKIMKVSLKENYKYEIQDKLKVNIKIDENPYGLDLKKVMNMAARKNKKRSFLFVSKLLGKHIPLNPKLGILTSSVLAHSYMDKIYKKHDGMIEKICDCINYHEHMDETYEKQINNRIDLKDPTIFIGFAETATGLGHGVFSSFKGEHTYIHTTREILHKKESLINFEEEHSHATSHRFYSIDGDFLNNEKKIVLIDDEITTGKTALNIIKDINSKYKRKEYTVLTILDWRNREDKLLYEEFEKNLNIKINVVSLISGAMNVEQKGEINDRVYEYENEKDSEIEVINLFEESYFTPVYYPSTNGELINYIPYIGECGRFGISTRDEFATLDKFKEIGKLLGKKRIGKDTLVLGTEEFMYVPMRISTYMGEGIKYHSTTRSPIYVNDERSYAIKSKYPHKSLNNNSVENYIYNLHENQYDDMFLFLERNISEERLDELKSFLKTLPIPKINIVICMGKRTVKTDKLGSYKDEDVTFLLKNINDLVKEQETSEREKLIQSGVHYSEMLPVEYEPSEEYIDLFYKSLNSYSKKVAAAVGIVSEKILNKCGKNLVLVSLARAGTPIGVLIRTYMKDKYNLHIPHYSVSIIRGKGIDENAIRYIIEKHPKGHIQFIDGWTGKGAITKVLKEAKIDFEKKYGYVLDDDLAVLADPAYCVSLCGTREDFLIPSACLNSTVSGLVSRTVHRKDLVGPHDFHGGKYYEELKEKDLSNFYINSIEKEFPEVSNEIKEGLKEEISSPDWSGLRAVKDMALEFNVDDINLIKPGIGETTRVLLRRVPWKILIREKSPNLEHILILAKEKNVPVEIYENMSYLCCGIIKNLKGKES
ncbi:MAG: phosphoribosyltransferase [Anaeromicrobium sp.]|jgi:orotate phosphoribosyltransferase|uniref:phosphoribosyltransferase n=1 Tax=Anaeromicrobium sp. TaxID=1929132 RepID=UPI0025DC0E9A|nr:phosphoribosyltransferase [Anaeromicrobium sp.]MCT4592847.1 phosphoribosyltransferase [Anaeromicrobium sp.]